MQAETESTWALSLTRLAPLAVSLCPWSLPPPPQVALSSPGQRKVDASGSSRSACRRITTSRTSHRRIQMKLSSLPCALAQRPATLIDSRSHLHKRDPRPFAPAVRPHHTHRRIATTTTHNCRASSPTIPAPSPPRRDHARYRYGVHRKRRSGRSGAADPGRRTHHTPTIAR